MGKNEWIYLQTNCDFPLNVQRQQDRHWTGPDWQQKSGYNINVEAGSPKRSLEENPSPPSSPRNGLWFIPRRLSKYLASSYTPRAELFWRKKTTVLPKISIFHTVSQFRDINQKSVMSHEIIFDHFQEKMGGGGGKEGQKSVSTQNALSMKKEVRENRELESGVWFKAEIFWVIVFEWTK